MSYPHTAAAQCASLTLKELIQAAEMLQHSGQVQEAIDLYRHWLANGRDEQKYLAWFNYGWLLQKQNNFNEAFNAYDQLTHNYASYLGGNASAA
jgi:tetratricopeptide (TPR) repeat protein